MSNWVGYAISVNCGEPLGCYQGTILEADGNTITLTKAFRNGFPYPKSQVTLNAADIKDLKILEARPEPSEQTHSTVAVTKSNKKVQRATVCENLQANHTGSGPNCSLSHVTCSNNNKTTINSRGPAGPARTKPIDIQGTRNCRVNTQTGSYGASSSTPKGRGTAAGCGVASDKARRRNEACFGDAASPAALDDFDFEGNLALFDKRALWEQIRHSHKPDVVRHADAATLRHDEDVLGARPPPAPRAILVPPVHQVSLYNTDAGVIVPGVTSRLRARLWSSLRELGVLHSAYALLARATADVALRLVGGTRRLDARNSHQAPVVVTVVGPHAAGAAGLMVARVLASHGARAHALLAAPPPPAPAESLSRELGALGAAGVTLAADPSSLPAPDLVVLSLHDPELCEEQEAYSAAVRWSCSARAVCVAVEPPPGGWPGVCARAAVVGVVPGHVSPTLGRVYLADVAPPVQIFTQHHIEYRTPFGACSILPLHHSDE